MTEENKQPIVRGFVQTIRNQGNIAFLIIRDTDRTIQAVVLKSAEEAFNLVKDLTVESVVAVYGVLKKEPQAPGGEEIQVEKIEILSKAAPELPIPIITIKGGEDTNQPQRLDWRWLDLRKSGKLDIFRLWTELEKGCRAYFDRENFIQFYSPTFMNAPSESGAEVFSVPYFDRTAYLAQSPQFYKQMAISSGFGKVFTFGPVFRAEPSFTTRHSTEFTSWDVEISYVNSHYDVMSVEEDMIIAAFEQAKSAGFEVVVPSKPFPKISMTEAKQKLKEKGIPSEKEHDLTPEEERELCAMMREETGHDFVFLTDWHISIRPFYHMRHEDNNELTKSFDLLYKGIEITTGAQREHRVEILEKQALEKGLTLEGIDTYLNFFRYGCPPHGGFALGPARLVMKILDLANIREATFLPRDVKRLIP